MKTTMRFFLCLFFLFTVTCLTAEEWAVRGGGTSNESGTAIARDNSGNIYVGGIFSGTTTFGATNLTSAGGNDIFVAKLDANGNWLWAVRAGGTGTDNLNGISVTYNGNVYITGDFESQANFGFYMINSSGNSDIYVAKLTTNGTCAWVHRGGGIYTDRGMDISADDDGNCYVTGYFYDTADFGTTSLTSVSAEDCVIAKLNSSGVWQWAVAASGPREQWGLGITHHYTYGVYVTGMFNTGITCGSTTLDTFGELYDQDVFICRLDSNGNWLWATQVGGLSSEYGRDLTVDTSGSVIVTGHFGNTTYCGPIPLTTYGSTDMFITKLDRNGLWLWATHAGGINGDYGYGITSDVNDNIYITGNFNGLGYFGTIQLEASDTETFVAKLSADGNWLWVRKAVSTEGNGGSDIVCLHNGNCFTVGSFTNTIGFGPNVLVSAGGSDVFVAKIADPEPQTPEDMSIESNGNDIILSWDPYEFDTWGFPLTPDYYFIYYNTVGSSSAYQYLTYVHSFMDTYVHQNAGFFSSNHFYNVTAVKFFDGSRSADEIDNWLSTNLQAGMNKDEVNAKIAELQKQ